MNCNDLMKKSLVTLKANEPAYLASKFMADANVGFLPVCEDGKVIGVLTDRDIALRVVRFNKPADTPASDIMTHRSDILQPVRQR